jgi:hypothetical protein
MGFPVFDKIGFYGIFILPVGIAQFPEVYGQASLHGFTTFFF